MAGMMDTVLHLRLNDRTVVGLAEASGDARLRGHYRRFVQYVRRRVMGLDLPIRRA